MTKFCVVWRTRTTTAKFKIYILNLTLRSILNFELALTVRNKLNDFRVSRDS